MKPLFSLVFTIILTSAQGLSAACIETYLPPASVICTNEITPLTYQIAPDPSGGITDRSVLIYSFSPPFPPGGSDIALVYSNNAIYHLIRFLPNGHQLIFYAADNSGSLADVGIPASGNPTRITENSSGTTYSTGGPFSVSYEFFTEPLSPVYVLSTNKLAIALDASGGVVVSWSTNAANFALYQSTNIFRATNWVVVTNTPLVSGEQNTVSFPGPLTGTRFFRLIAQ